MSHVVSVLAIQNGLAPALASPGTGFMSRLAVVPGTSTEKGSRAGCADVLAFESGLDGAATCPPTGPPICIEAPPALFSLAHAERSASVRNPEQSCRRFIQGLGIAIVSSLFAWGCAASGSAASKRFEFSRLAMGVEARIVLHAPSERAAIQAANAAFSRIAQIEEALSDWRETSELSRVCARAGEGPIAVGAD